ncbi:MAG: hypothetical protein WCR42_00860 [bacterium]
MKRIKLLSLFAIFAIGIVLTSCDFSSPTYIEGGNADIQMDMIVLKASDWKVNTTYQFQWYQEMVLTGSSISVSDEGVVIAYYRNEYDGWEALPATSVFWDTDNVIYSTEFWYSFDSRGVYFDYRNTKPIGAAPPQNNIDVKLVIIDRVYFDKIKDKGINVNNYNDLVAKVKSDGGKVNSANNTTK